MFTVAGLFSSMRRCTLWCAWSFSVLLSAQHVAPRKGCDFLKAQRLGVRWPVRGGG